MQINYLRKLIKHKTHLLKINKIENKQMAKVYKKESKKLIRIIKIKKSIVIMKVAKIIKKVNIKIRYSNKVIIIL